METLKTRSKQFTRPQDRSLAVESATVDMENRTATFSFSSEYPVERWFGIEVLSHDSGAPDLSRLKDGGSVRDEHDGDQIGVVEDAWLENRRGWVKVKYSANNERADLILKDMRDGIRRNVSFRYRINESVLSGADEKDGVRVERWLVTRWEPIHVAHVADPADPSVGIREAEEKVETTFIREQRKEEKKMENPNPTATVDVEAIRKQERERHEASISELKRRQAEMTAFREMYGDKEGVRDVLKTAEKEDWSLERVGKEILNIVAKKVETPSTPASEIGLSRKETKEWDLHRAILNVLEGKDDNLEGETQRELTKRFGAPKHGHIYVPYDVQKRDLSVATATAGGYLVGSNKVGFIELLRNSQIVGSLGVSRLTGLKGDIYMPKHTGASTAYWIAEGVAPDESNLTFGQMAMTPKTVGGVVEMTRELLMQSDPSAQNLTMTDLAKTLALAVDLAVLSGTGAAGQPRGLYNTSGIGTVTWDNTARWTKILEFESDVLTANAALAGCKWLTTPAVQAVLKGNVKFGTGTSQPLMEGKDVNGYPCLVSNQQSSGYLTFGDWSQIVVGEWGTLELKVIETGTNYRAGNIEILAFHSVDVGVRQPTAFSYATSVS